MLCGTVLLIPQGVKCVHETKTKHQHEQISVKDDIKTIIVHYHVCNRPTQSVQIMHMDLLGNIYKYTDKGTIVGHVPIVYWSFYCTTITYI